VSPVSVKTNSRNCDIGRRTPFAGRLKGVAFRDLARAFESNDPKPSTPVSCSATHCVSKTSTKSPSASVVASTVTRWSASMSRLMRVVQPRGIPPLKIPPSWPW
jgi:hypothetical protein